VAARASCSEGLEGRDCRPWGGGSRDGCGQAKEAIKSEAVGTRGTEERPPGALPRLCPSQEGRWPGTQCSVSACPLSLGGNLNILALNPFGFDVCFISRRGVEFKKGGN
jgi:hypothetical protein